MASPIFDVVVGNLKDALPPDHNPKLGKSKSFALTPKKDSLAESNDQMRLFVF